MPVYGSICGAYDMSLWELLIISIKGRACFDCSAETLLRISGGRESRGRGKALGHRTLWEEWGGEVDHALPLFRMGITYAS
jgi:hypothetical protein